jgi:hypothetical protein
MHGGHTKVFVGQRQHIQITISNANTGTTINMAFLEGEVRGVDFQ